MAGNSMSFTLVTIFILAMVLSPTLPSGTAQTTAPPPPDEGPFCPACVCCGEAPPGGCCPCCVSPASEP